MVQENRREKFSPFERDNMKSQEHAKMNVISGSKALGPSVNFVFQEIQESPLR